jgi:excisionase family DNA binding protein
MMEKLMKAIEVAEYLSLSKSGAHALMKRGQIPTVRFGKSVRVRVEDLERFILNHRESEITIKKEEE